MFLNHQSAHSSPNRLYIIPPDYFRLHPDSWQTHPTHTHTHTPAQFDFVRDPRFREPPYASWCVACVTGGLPREDYQARVQRVQSAESIKWFQSRRSERRFDTFRAQSRE